VSFVHYPHVLVAGVEQRESERLAARRHVDDGMDAAIYRLEEELSHAAALKSPPSRSIVVPSRNMRNIDSLAPV